MFVMVPQLHFVEEKRPKAIRVRMLRAMLSRVLKGCRCFPLRHWMERPWFYDEICEGGREAGLDEEGLGMEGAKLGEEASKAAKETVVRCARHLGYCYVEIFHGHVVTPL
jgi:hypothetical protein